MPMKSTVAMASGTQPPWANFIMLAENSEPSTTSSRMKSGMTSAHGHFQPRTASVSTSMVVISMVPVTAMP